MNNEFDAQHLNVLAFAREAAQLQITLPLARFPRLLEETGGAGADLEVHFQARGLLETNAAGQDEPWLLLVADVVLPLTCQRCLGPADIPLSFEAEYRFVATEALAEVEDEESEEDVLVLSRDFDLLALVEDEFLMALPVAPKHEQCPVALKLQVADADFVQEATEKPNPFAVLEQLKKKGLG